MSAYTELWYDDDECPAWIINEQTKERDRERPRAEIPVLDRGWDEYEPPVNTPKSSSPVVIEV